jgi:sulfotransferase family protein
VVAALPDAAIPAPAIPAFYEGMSEVIAPDLPADLRASLPTFFVIGASKCGTTSLHEYLAAHPEIAMSQRKEPECFVYEWTERIHRYRDLFPDAGAQVRGESSTGYSAYPWQPEVPDRIRATVPDARIVYVVRDPIPRTLSHYAQNMWDGVPVRPFAELVSDPDDPMNMPVWASRYATQIERWLERFDDDRVLVLDQRALLQQRAATLRRIFTFLGVDPEFTSPQWYEQHNVAKDHRVPNALARRLGPVGRLIGHTPKVWRLVTRPIPTPEPTPEQRAQLVAVLKPEAQRLHALTGLPVDHWSL